MEKIQKEHEQGGTYSSVDKNTTGTDSTSVGLEDLDIPQDNQSNKSGEQLDSRPWLFKKGQSGNPSGRAKGSKSLKEYAKEMLAKMTEDERQEYLKGLSKDVIWKMAEGNPANILSGDKESPIVIKLSKEIADQNDIDSNPSNNSERQN